MKGQSVKRDCTSSSCTISNTQNTEAAFLSKSDTEAESDEPCKPAYVKCQRFQGEV